MAAFYGEARFLCQVSTNQSLWLIGSFRGDATVLADYALTTTTTILVSCCLKQAQHPFGFSAKF